MKLIGYVDGIEVTFDFYPPNIYKAIIPKRLNGRYIVQLKAVDEAGNETSTADVYMYIDFQKMEFKILDDKFKFNIEKSKIGYVDIDILYEINELRDKFCFRELCNQYSYRELVM